MKKEYIKPEVIVEEIVLESMMMVDSFTSGGDIVDDDVEPWSNKRRGDWGDLWSEGEE